MPVEIDVTWTNGEVGVIRVTAPGFDANEKFKSNLIFEYETAGGGTAQSVASGHGKCDADGNAVTYAFVAAPNGHLTGNIWDDNVVVDEQVSLG